MGRCSRFARAGGKRRSGIGVAVVVNALLKVRKSGWMGSGRCGNMIRSEAATVQRLVGEESPEETERFHDARRLAQ